MTGPPGRRLGCLFRLRLVEPQETGYTAKSHMRKLNRSEQLAKYVIETVEKPAGAEFCCRHCMVICNGPRRARQAP
jgi:hypothetical protein